MRGIRGFVVVALVPCVAALGACGGREGSAGRAVPPDTARWGGYYVSDTIPGAAHQRVVRLQVGPDTVATVNLEVVGIGITFHPGRWSARGDELTMQPTRGDGTPNEVAFRWRLDGDRLIPLKWDRTVYGDRGVELRKQSPPAAPPADSSAGAKR
jgi:hypothetical protein